MSETQGVTPIDEARVRSVTEALGALRDRGAAPQLPPGESVPELRRQLEDLPKPPEGDTEVHADATIAHEALLAARANLATHDKSRPSDPVPVDAGLDPEDLRSLANVLGGARPEEDLTRKAQLADLQRAAASADEAYRREVASHQTRAVAYDAAQKDYEHSIAEYQEARARYQREIEAIGELRRQSPPVAAETKRPARTALFVAGGLLSVVGIGLAAAINLPLGLFVFAAGLALIITGTRMRPAAERRDALRARGALQPAETPAPAPPTPPAPPGLESPGSPPVAPAPNPAISQLQAEIGLNERQMSEHDERKAAALKNLSDHSLPPEPAELKRLAGAVEARAGHERTASQWRARREELAEDLDRSAAGLVTGIRRRDSGVFVGEEQAGVAEVDRAINLYHAYKARCRNRAEQATSSKRRADLEKALETREVNDRQHSEALRAHEAVAAHVQKLARELSVDDETSPPEALLRTWLGEQDESRKRFNKGREAAAKLEQLLGGATPAELEAERGSLKERAAPRPVPMPDDPEEELERLTPRCRIAADEVSNLDGQAAELQGRLPSVAEAMEREAEAERKLEAVKQLARIIDLAEKGLCAAKDKVNASIAPALRERILPWLPRVTDGRYSDLVVDPADLLVRVREPGGAYREATVMSHGTMEQIYLLVRLALADLLATRNEAAPVILDDVTVQSDPGRTVAFLGLLHEISRERQVILFSQEPEVVEWGKERLRGAPDQMLELAVRA